MGNNAKDRKFDDYWNRLKNSEYIIGAYHYYRPNENPELQFKNFKNRVNFKSGNLIPVLNIENKANLVMTI